MLALIPQAAHSRRMDDDRRPPRWPVAIQLLHWVTVVLLVGLLVSGWRSGMHGISSLHLTLGVILLAIFTARVLARLLTRAPAPLARSRAFRVIWAATQLVLYFVTFATILTGLAAFAPHPFMPHARLFGTFELPRLLPLPPVLRRLAAQGHLLLVWALLAAVALHVAAVIAHNAFTGRGTIRRMAGRRGEPVAGA